MKRIAKNTYVFLTNQMEEYCIDVKMEGMKDKKQE